MRAGINGIMALNLSKRVWLYYWVVVGSILATSSSVSPHDYGNSQESGQMEPFFESNGQGEKLYNLTEQLMNIDSISACAYGTLCSVPAVDRRFFAGVQIGSNIHFAGLAKEKINLIASLVHRWKSSQSPPKNETVENELVGYILETIESVPQVQDVRFVTYSPRAEQHRLYQLMVSGNNKQMKDGSPSNNDNNSNNNKMGSSSSSGSSVHSERVSSKKLEQSPWFLKPPFQASLSNSTELEEKFDLSSGGSDQGQQQRYPKAFHRHFPGPVWSYWTWPYFLCTPKSHSNNNNNNNNDVNNNSHFSRAMLNSNSDNEYENETLSNNLQQNGNHDNNHKGSSSSSSVNCNSEGSAPNCNKIEGRFLVSFTAAFPIYNKSYGIYGIISFDVDLTKYDINQCDYKDEEERKRDKADNPLHVFRGTHKCDKNSSTCEFQKGKGWRQGMYRCQCHPSHHAFNPNWINCIKGDIAEGAWWEWKKPGTAGMEDESEDGNGTYGRNNKYYISQVTCKRCQEGCEDCVSGESCLAEISWMFRVGLLSVSMVSIICTVGIILIVYKYRRVPVLKSSSPIFHCIVLVGCIVMYTEMVALFPVLTMQTCIAVKWTRHLGFCITYTALYMKLCRVYLTFRVKSAHKIKLTEKHLLHWMSPIMVIMLLYLFAWTLSSPPQTQVIETVERKRFIQCDYNWWDHALAIGEVIFLIYGVWICYRIRENPDAQFISYSIYNIAVINILMAALHLIILPKAGPDAKYLFAFIRTQMSTTVTIALVFGSKLYCVLWGPPKELKEMPSSANGFGHDTLDLAEENQQLKEELQKLAGQMERLKCYAMGKNNPHLKQSSANISNADLEFNSNRHETFTTL